MSEQVVKNSRFIGTVGKASSVVDARGFIARVRDRYPDANHHAWAYKVEALSGVIGSSDDGEPGGTAGRPMLAVLDGSGLCDVVVVGTRFFGGIKLGPGGLVRAYSGVARQALEHLPHCVYVLHHLAEIELDYGWYGGVQRMADQTDCKILETEFGACVKVVLAIPTCCIERVADTLADLTNGQVVLRQHWLSEQYIEKT
ncbi:MAG: IMPACT family protein [Anaerolineae bacterium]